MTTTTSTSPSDRTTTDGPTGPAWLLDGLASTSGTLRMTAGRLSFTSDDRRHGIDLAVDEGLRVVFPRRFFGTGMVVSAPGVRFRFSLTHPDGLANPTAARAGTTSGRAAARAWRRRFRPASAT